MVAKKIKACVIGDPIKHSRSPVIHKYWLKKYGIAGDYVKQHVLSDNLADFITRLEEHEYAGCNVTIPHKQDVFSLVEVNDPVTRAIGAINTIYIEDGKKYGINTDGTGFLLNLTSTIKHWESRGKTALIIGAGGAARAIIASLMADGIDKIIIANRTKQNSRALAAYFSKTIDTIHIDNDEISKTRPDLLVNTTSLGMTGQPELDIDLSVLPASCVISDIVYSPLETKLLREAAASGFAIVKGLGMLLHQAVPGFEKWFGVRPEVTQDLYDYVVSDLEKG